MRIVVGGSLSGLSVALALEGRGHDVTVLERDASLGAHGAGLGVDRDLLEAVTGADPTRVGAALPVITSNRDSTAWTLLHDWLDARCRERDRIEVIAGVEVAAIEADGDAVVARSIGRTDAADMVVGADGYRSIVRRHVAPDRPDATYAGYLLWRGLVDERDIAAPPGRADLPVSVAHAGPFRLVAYYVPGADGSVRVGERQISWAWYDPRQNDLMHRLGAVRDGAVRFSPGIGQLPPSLVDELRTSATSLWPAPWGPAVAASIDARKMLATPIAEYLPSRMTAAGTALIGDAAHVASPMTGSGYRYALLDALALADAVAGRSDIPSALAAFETARLAPSRELATYGMRWGTRYLAETGQGGSR